MFYAAELFRQYADEHRGKIYRAELLHLPEPKFFVFYNGKKKESARHTLKLSDAFGKRTCLEVIVEFYNLNAGMNDAFVAADESLNNYCTFLNLFEQLKADGIDPNHALAASFKYCIANDIMAEYLLTIKKELASMLALEYDPEAERQAWIDYGMEQGIERGIDIGREQVAKNLLTLNLSTSDIIKATGLTAEQIRKLAETAD